MSKIIAILGHEFRKALPAVIFFLILFHLIALTKAVALDEYSLTALRAVGATVGALLVAKAILVVEALPIGWAFFRRRWTQILWKTLLYSTVALLFRVVEELIPLASKHGGLAAGIMAMEAEVAWPLFGVFALWIIGGLLLYCLASELTRAIGPERIKEILLRAHDSRAES